MRILILVDAYLPSTRSGAKQIHDLGVEFRRQGHQVTILAPSHAIPERLDARWEDGLNVLRVRMANIKRANRALRAFEEARLPKRLWRRAGRLLRESPCDLVVFYSPTIFFGELVRRLKAEYRCPAYLILRDIFPQWAVDVGILRQGPVLGYFRRKERQQYAVADTIAVQSQADLAYFSRNVPVTGSRIELLYNWASTEERNVPVTNYRWRFGLQDKVVFFYGGNLGVAQDVGNLMRLAANVSHDSRIYFVIVGEGTCSAELRQAIAARGLKNLLLLPPVDQREYLGMAAEFDVGLVTLDRRLQTHNVPGKILSYLYWGMPVLASINPGNDLFAILRESHAGFCLANGNDAELAAAALKLAEDPALRAAMGRNGRRLLEQKFSARAAADQILRPFTRPSHTVEVAPAAAAVGFPPIPANSAATSKASCSTDS